MFLVVKTFMFHVFLGLKGTNFTLRWTWKRKMDQVKMYSRLKTWRIATVKLCKFTRRHLLIGSMYAISTYIYDKKQTIHV